MILRADMSQSSEPLLITPIFLTRKSISLREKQLPYELHRSFYVVSTGEIIPSGSGQSAVPTARFSSSPLPPCVDFHRARRPPPGYFASFPSADICCIHSITSPGSYFEAPRTLSPFALYTAFPRADYYGRAYCDRGIRELRCVSTPLLPLSFTSLISSPMFHGWTQTKSCRWWLSNNLSPHIAAPEWAWGTSG